MGGTGQSAKQLEASRNFFRSLRHGLGTSVGVLGLVSGCFEEPLHAAGLGTSFGVWPLVSGGRLQPEGGGRWPGLRAMVGCCPAGSLPLLLPPAGAVAAGACLPEL